MNFTKISEDTNCDCIKDTEIDNESHFVRKLNKDFLIEKDILSHWERGIGQESTDCKEICSYKGLSINKMSEEQREIIIKKYINTSKINPAKGKFYIRFKIKPNSGVVKFEPSNNDVSHYNLLKSDDFTLDSLEIIETVKFI